MEAMSVVGGSILCAFFDGVLDRLKSMDFLKYVDQVQVLNQLEKWEKLLRRIYAVLDDAEEKQTTSHSVQMWLTDLKHLAYDLEDLLDELATELQRRKLGNNNQVCPSKVRRIISLISSAASPSTIKFNVEMVSRIDDITARLDEIVKQKDDLSLDGSNGWRRVNRVSERLPSSSLANQAKVYGREEDKKAILQLLKAETGDVDVAVIPIIGMGGLGKTTLAQLVYNDPSLEFDFKAWVCVGEDFDIYRITKAILQSREADDKDLNSLQVKLKQKLFGKKFLIILDDVWSENYEQWTLFCCPFEAGAVGSRIIITTRNQEVSSMTGTIPVYTLKELPYDECLSVFAQHALGAMNFNQNLELEEIGKAIVKRCKGLPLAAKVLGGLLRGKINVNAWKEVLNSELWHLPNNKANVLPALRLSYLYLPPHLKRCFAYCAIFPKDYEFDKDDLVLLWKAEGFLCHPKDMKPTEGLGHKYFDELLSRSFFQQSNDNKSRYVMHDLINDLARFVSRGACFHLVDNEVEGANSYANIRHSAFVARYCNVFQRFKCFEEMKKLRTFLSVQPPSYSKENFLSRKVLHDLVPRLKCLRVLSLTLYYDMELPNSVGELKQLRYLDLSYTYVKRLPESVGRLFNMETLKLRGCQKLIELPKSIYNLINLQYLDIRDTENLREMPQHIGNLTNLLVLTKFAVGKGNNGLKISELKKFSHCLEGKLQITGLQNVEDTRDVGFVNLKEKPGLLELDLEFCPYSSNSDGDMRVLNSLEPHQNLSRLTILYFCGRQFPSWIGNPIFSNMVELKVVGCWKITLLPPLGRLASLKKLIIQKMGGVEEVGNEFYEDDSTFSSLEILHIEDMKKWKQWWWSNGLSDDCIAKFPNLRKLHILECPHLVGKLPSFLPSLEELQIIDCPQLVESPKMLPSLAQLSIGGWPYRCREVVLKNLHSVPCLTHLEISYVSGLVRLDESLIQALVALQNLRISGCDELKYLWADGTNLDYLTGLRSLSIDDCSRLVSLVDGEEGLLPCNLESLTIIACNDLKELPNGLHSLKSLNHMRVYICRKLHSLPARGLPYSLKQLVIERCPSLEFFYSKEMSHLEKFKVIDCKSVSCSPNAKFPDSLNTLSFSKGTIRFIESFYYGFSHLTNLEISDCDELEMLPERELHIPTLISLTIKDCKRLKSLSNHMQTFHHLQELEIRGCDEFEGFPERGLLNPSLVSFKIEDCRNLSQPMAEWGLQRLTSLVSLVIFGPMRSTRDMVWFPDDEGSLLPTSLTHLTVRGLHNLESISRGIQNLTSLRSLYIFQGPNLKSFPNEGLPPSLEELRICQCPRLKKRCRKDKGDYWPIISHIPRAYVYEP